jgi:hypothetical protein
MSKYGIITLASLIDASVGPNIPRGKGRLSFVLIEYDLRSNMVVVERPGQPPDPPARDIEPTPDTPGMAPEGRPANSYLPSPEVPGPGGDDVPSLTFSAESSTASILVLRGGFRVRISSAFAPQRARSIREVDGNECTALAVVPLTLVLASPNAPVRRVDLVIPVYGDAPPNPDAFLTGSFHVDALRDSPPLRVGEYAAWGLLDGQLFGPVMFSVTK